MRLTAADAHACSVCLCVGQIGTLQEETEAEFGRQRGVLEAEIQELREQVKRDAGELEELSDTLKATLLKLRDYQERVLVLEDSAETEARHRLETDETVDLLKVRTTSSSSWEKIYEALSAPISLMIRQLEVEKLRQLVRKQREEMAEKERDEQARHKLELERVQQQLRDAQEELLSERRDRIQEKQRELDERLMRSMASAPAAQSESEKILPRCEREQAPQPAIPQLDMSSFLNTSTELPERIKDIMDEWKQRMEDALAGTIQSVSKHAAAGIPAPDNEHGIADADAEGEDAESAHLSGEEQHIGSRHKGTANRNEGRPRLSPDANEGRQCNKSPRRAARNRFDRYLRSDRFSIEASGGDSDSDGSNGDSNGDIRSVDGESKRHQSHHKRHGRESRAVPSRYRQHRRSDAESNISGKDSVCQASQRRSFERDQHTREGRARRKLQLKYEDDDVDSGVADSTSSQSFVLIDRLQGGRRSGSSSSSFSGLFESSLFEVVDAIEGGSETPDAHAHVLHGSRTGDEASRGDRQNSQRGSEGQSAKEASTSPTSTSSTTATRLQSLLKEMQVRERKLARLDAGSSQAREEDNRATTAVDTAATVGGDDGADHLVDADFELFNQVKDVYESDLLSTRQQQHPQEFTHLQSQPARGSFGPPLSPQDLSVREAIEQEMAELLQQGALRPQ